jgi:hypothetical protein
VTCAADLAADVAAALVEAGIPVHDCHGPGRPLGGCCLLANPGDAEYPAGVIVETTPLDCLASRHTGRREFASPTHKQLGVVRPRRAVATTTPADPSRGPGAA